MIGVQGAGDLADGQYTSLQGVLFYLATYGFAIGRRLRARHRWSATPAARRPASPRWAGLGKRSPLVAGVFAFFLLSMAGIPLTSGFVGKWAVFTSAMSAGAWPVVLVAIASSIIAVFFYIRLIRLMFFSEPEPGETAARHRAVAAHRRRRSRSASRRPLVLGVVPGPVLDLVAGAGDFIR